MEAEARFRAMGSDVHVIVVDGPEPLLDTARELIEELEQLWSRFRATSEMTRLNALAGCTVPVSDQTLALVQRALEGARITGGRYDPTVLGAMLRAGYDRSFELLTDDEHSTASALTQGWERIAVDPVLRTVTLPSGIGFDPGGIGKGYAADLVVRELLIKGAAGACVNMGGDLRVEGTAPGGEDGARPWAIAIEHPFRAEPAALVGLHGGAVATSTRARRTWGPADDRRHHLIDPATGLPATGHIVSATVIAAQAWQAEVLSKAAFLAGLPGAFDLLAAIGADGLMVDDEGDVHASPGFHRFTKTNDEPTATAMPSLVDAARKRSHR